jgi:hypothetical protein
MSDNTTPRPWVAARRSNSVALQYQGDPVYTITIAQVYRHDPNGNERLPDDANADLIVRAVNAHEDLIAALQQAHEDVCSFRCPSVKREGEEWTHSERCVAISAALAKARNV